jgi:hypothetical protein
MAPVIPRHARSVAARGSALDRGSNVVRCVRVLLVADTALEIWIARMASALTRLVTYLGERDVRIAE